MFLPAMAPESLQSAVTLGVLSVPTGEPLRISPITWQPGEGQGGSLAVPLKLQISLALRG